MRRIVVATGLAREAAIAQGPGVHCVTGAANAKRLSELLEQAIAHGAQALLSFGIAGALAQNLRPGMLMIGRAVITREGCITTDERWSMSLAQRLAGAIIADIVGQDDIVASVAAKRALHETTGASIVDTESHVVAQMARAHAIPFAVMRAVSDPAARGLPRAACVGLDEMGRPDLRAVVRALAAVPSEVFPLARTALDASRALRALSAGRRRLGAGLGYPDLGELLVDMA